ncbi:molybdate-binding periplasmic protein [Actinobacillus equuli]|nr:molybdate-binding periplasmic protein [Actinobacillus equuli]
MLFHQAWHWQRILPFCSFINDQCITRNQSRFAKQYPDDKVVFSFASSSVLAKQIEQDAPADVFISADLKWMDYLKRSSPPKHKISVISLK